MWRGEAMVVAPCTWWWLKVMFGNLVRTSTRCLGLTPGWVRIRGRRVPCGSKRLVVTPEHRRYREQDMLEALRAAAGGGAKPLTKTAYDEHQRRHGGPSGIWLIRHYGTWRAAVL